MNSSGSTTLQVLSGSDTLTPPVCLGNVALLESCCDTPFQLNSDLDSLLQMLWGPKHHIEPNEESSIPGDKALDDVILCDQAHV